MVLLLLTGCRSQKTSKAWPLPGYDNYNTRFYPFPGRVSKPYFKEIGRFGSFEHREVSDPLINRIENLLLAKDINGDGILEICVHARGSEAVIYTPRGKIVKNFSGIFSYYAQKGLNNLEPCLTCKDSVFLTLDSTRIVAVPPGCNSWFYYINDINRDGKLEIIDSHWEQVGTQFETRKAYIHAHALTTGAVLWSFPIAPWPYLDGFLDIDGDGKLELLFGTYSPNNGVYLNGMTDVGEGYVLLLDCYGNLLWRQTFYGSYLRTMTAVSDLNQDRHLEIIAFCDSWCDSCPGTDGVIALLDVTTGNIIHQYKQNSVFTSAAIANMDGDKNLEVVAASRDGRISVFDCQLKKLREYQLRPDSAIQYDGVDIYVWALNDIDNDGRPEVIATSGFEEFLIRDPFGYNSRIHEPKLLILDNDLHLRQQIPLDTKCWQGIIADLLPGGTNEIVLLTDKIEIFSAQ